MKNIEKYFHNDILPEELENIRKEENEKGDTEIGVDLEQLWKKEMPQASSLSSDDERSVGEVREHLFRKITIDNRHSTTKNIALWLISAAAVTLLLVSVSLTWKMHMKDEALLTHLTEIITQEGETVSLKMPDGTTVRVNGESRLSYPAASNGKYRKVALNGEAYFSVAHDTQHPFVVESNGFEVMVKGTKFNIRARQSDSRSMVWLDEGRVDIKSVMTDETVTLRPGQKAEINSSTGKIRSEQADQNGVHTSWLKHKVSFHNTPFHEVLNTICDNYDLSLVLSKGVSNVSFTGTLPNNNLKEALKTLEIVYNVRIDVSKEVMTVHN